MVDKGHTRRRELREDLWDVRFEDRKLCVNQGIERENKIDACVLNCIKGQAIILEKAY